MAQLRGLKPVLLEGTGGRFDTAIRFYRMPFDFLVEHWWASTKVAIHGRRPFPYRVHPLVGSHHTWDHQLPTPLHENAFVISETNNPQWCAVTFLHPHEGNQIPYIQLPPFDSGIACSPLIVTVFYNVDQESIWIDYFDMRFNRSSEFRIISRQRLGGRFDGNGTDHPRYAFEDGVSYEGRGWKKFNHEHLYALGKNIGLDFQDPELLSGRYLIVNEELR